MNENRSGPKANGLLGEVIRFILAGGFNTLLTLGVYQLALFFIPHNFAYAISWLVGIGYLLIVYPTKVFPGGQTSPMRNVMVVLIYLSVFTLSLWCLERLVGIGIHERVAIFVVLVFSSSINFVLMRMVYRK